MQNWCKKITIIPSIPDKGIDVIKGEKVMHIINEPTYSRRATHSIMNTVDSFNSKLGIYMNAKLKKPLHPLNAFNIFFMLERQRIVGNEPLLTLQEKKENIIRLLQERQNRWANEDNALPVKRKHIKTHGKISFNLLGKMISLEWKNVDTFTKKMLEVFACTERQLYKRNMEKYKQSCLGLERQTLSIPKHYPPEHIRSLHDTFQIPSQISETRNYVPLQQEFHLHTSSPTTNMMLHADYPIVSENYTDAVFNFADEVFETVQMTCNPSCHNDVLSSEQLNLTHNQKMKTMKHQMHLMQKEMMFAYQQQRLKLYMMRKMSNKYYFQNARVINPFHHVAIPCSEVTVDMDIRDDVSCLSYADEHQNQKRPATIPNQNNNIPNETIYQYELFNKIHSSMETNSIGDITELSEIDNFSVENFNF